MSKLLSEPVSRAEAIGWAVFVLYGVPSVLSIWLMPDAFEQAVRLLRDRSEVVTPVMRGFLALGGWGYAAILAFCVLLPLGALLSRQRPLIKLAAPLICGALSLSLSLRFRSALEESAAATSTLLKMEADAAARAERAERETPFGDFDDQQPVDFSDTVPR